MCCGVRSAAGSAQISAVTILFWGKVVLMVVLLGYETVASVSDKIEDASVRMWREITAAVAAAAVVGGGRSRSSLLMGDAAGERATTQPDPRRGQLFVAGGCGGLSAVCGGSFLILCALSQSATELPVFDAAGSGVAADQPKRQEWPSAAFSLSRVHA